MPRRCAAWKRHEVRSACYIVSLTGAIRYLVIPAVELNASVTYVDIIEDDTLLTLGAVGRVLDNVALRASYTFGSDWTGYNLASATRSDLGDPL